jgi:hypothetical protein
MDLSTLANVATALTVLTAVGFGLLETRRARHERAERAAFAAVQAILTPEWMRSMIIVHSIPEGCKPSQIEADAHLLAAVQAVGMILEGLGYSVYARIVPLHVVADLMGGTVRLAWRKVRAYVEEERRRRKRSSGFNGWPPNWSKTRRAKLACRSARTTPIVIGNPSEHHLRFAYKSENVSQCLLI